MAGKTQADRHRLRATFTQDAELYERARPRYPEQMFDDLVALTAIAGGAHILEIGCGTGQATLPMARRGFRLTAVELGAEMAAVARRNASGMANVTVHNAAFEAWTPPAEPFGLVMAAESFHWIDPGVRWQKSAACLQSGGAVAIISGHHVSGRDDAFFNEVQRCYERYMPGTPPGLRLSAPNELRYGGLDHEAERLFERPTWRRYVWDVDYATGEYLDVLNTYSGHRDLDPANRRRLYHCVAELLDLRYGGHVRKTYLTQMMVAWRR